MPALRLTKRAIEGLQRRAREAQQGFYAWDSDVSGFGCWVTPKGKVSFCVQGRPGGKHGKTKRITFRAKDLADARLKARSLLVDMASGVDLMQRKREQRRAIVATDDIPRLGATVDLYIKRNRKPGRYWDELEKRFKREIVPQLGKSTKLSAISKAKLRDMLEAKEDAGHHGGARLLYAALAPFFKWCVEKDKLPTNPLSDLSRPSPLPSRDRRLTDSEIVTFWKATASIPPTLSTYGPFYRLLLLTLQRREEVGAMAWSEIDGSQWTIPGTRTKNKKPHIVPLSPQALAVIESIERIEGCPYLFPVTGRNGEWSTISAYSDAKEALDKIMGSDVPPWRVHDLRRTGRTTLAKLKVPREVSEKVLNHTPRDKLDPVYNLYEYIDERKHALEAWGSYVSQLVSPQRRRKDNVLAFRTN